VSRFLDQHANYELTSTGLPDFAKPDDVGQVRILPGLLEAEGGLDGFFIARLVRAG
jgi:16S rRNA (cytosine967-C5)-methyltransferase